MPAKKNIGPRKRTESTARVCPLCGQPKRLGAECCKRCLDKKNQGKHRRKTGGADAVKTVPINAAGQRLCAGPARKRFQKQCLGVGTTADAQTTRCEPCNKAWEQLKKAAAERRAKKRRPGPEAVNDEGEWQRNYRNSLEQLQNNRDAQSTGPRYVTVKEIQDGQTKYVTKVDLRRTRAAKQS